MEKQKLSFWQIWNMSFGFLGIQFGWGLQMANMGPIYKFLGAQAHEVPFLFLAAPLTGFIVQPIIGYLSDRTWHPFWGRRRPYFLVGAILSTLALIAMPNSTSLWMAAGILWILDSSINISMEPFRAFVVDKLPQKQHALGFGMQAWLIGLGAVIASALPWVFTNWFGVVSTDAEGTIPESVKYSFYIGAVAFLGAVLYTVLTTKEHPPEDLEAFKRKKAESKGVLPMFTEIFSSIRSMPKVMKQVAFVQFFTWVPLFLMWFYYTSVVGSHVFGGEEGSALYREGVEFGGLTLAFYNIITFLVALLLPVLASRISKKYTHLIALVLGGIGLISVGFVPNKYWLYGSMTGVGIAWASILSMPYAIFASSLPKEKVGTYMGIFNFFIVLPEIIAALFFGKIMQHFLGNDELLALILGGCIMIFAGLMCLRINENQPAEKQELI